jgi:hypothetical protein
MAGNASVEYLLGFETSFGVPDTSVAFKTVTKGDTLSPSRTLTSRKLFDGTAYESRPSQGNRESSGGITVPIQPVAFGHFAKAFSGVAPTTTGASNPYTHTFVPSADGGLPLTLETKEATGKYKLTKGAYISEISYAPDSEGSNLNMSINFIAQDIDPTQTTSIWSGATVTDLTQETDFFDHFDGNSSGGSVITPTGFSLSLSNPYKPRYVMDGQPVPARLIPDRFVLNGSITIPREDIITVTQLARSGTSDNLTLSLVIDATKQINIIIPTVDWEESALNLDADTVDPSTTVNFISSGGFSIEIKNSSNGTAYAI